MTKKFQLPTKPLTAHRILLSMPPNQSKPWMDIEDFHRGAVPGMLRDGLAVCLDLKGREIDELRAAHEVRLTKEGQELRASFVKAIRSHQIMAEILRVLAISPPGSHVALTASAVSGLLKSMGTEISPSWAGRHLAWLRLAGCASSASKDHPAYSITPTGLMIAFDNARIQLDPRRIPDPRWVERVDDLVDAPIQPEIPESAYPTPSLNILPRLQKVGDRLLATAKRVRKYLGDLAEARLLSWL
jgi:hypothetical protein